MTFTEKAVDESDECWSFLLSNPIFASLNLPKRFSHPSQILTETYERAASTDDNNSYGANRFRGIIPSLYRKLVLEVSKQLYPIDTLLLKSGSRSNVRRVIPFYDSVLDSVFQRGNSGERGGLICSPGIHEVFGQSAVGKTQFLMHLALANQLPQWIGDPGGSTLFICTEDGFPFTRLFQMCPKFQSLLSEFLTTKSHDTLTGIEQTHHLMPHHLITGGGEEHENSFESFGDHIYVKHVLELDQLVTLLSSNQIINLMEQLRATGKPPLRLVAIDSIAALVRAQGPKLTARDKVASLMEITSLLRDLQQISGAEESSGPAIILVNQVTDLINPGVNASTSSGSSVIPYQPLDCLMGGGSSNLRKTTFIPSMGLSWSYCIDTRILIERIDPSSTLRRLTILYSNVYPNCESNTSNSKEPTSCVFDITADGIRGIPSGD